MKSLYKAVVIVTFAFMPIAAYAQGINLGNLGSIPPPPQHPSVDENGVDIVSGHVSHERLELFIGGEGIGSLQLVRSYNSTGGFKTNFDNEIIEDLVMNTPSIFRSVNIVFGLNSESFSEATSSTVSGFRVPSGSSYRQISSNPANYIYTRKDGSYISFTHHNRFQYYYYGGYNAKALADFVQFRDGVRWTYHYKDYYYNQNNVTGNVHRVQSITSNTGYQIKFYYETNSDPINSTQLSSWSRPVKAIAINNAHEYCDLYADSCTLQLPWLEVKYDYWPNSAPGYYLSVTNPSGERMDYANSGFRDPGHAAMNKSYTFQTVNIPCVVTQYRQLCPDIKVSSATVNGATTVYTYDDGIVTATGPGAITNTYTHWTSEEWRDPTGTEPTDINLGPVMEHTDALGRKVRYEYQQGPWGAFGQLIKATLPEGNIVQHTRNADGIITQTLARAKPGSGLSDITEGRTVNAFGQPTSITDPRGQTATFTYDPTHGGVLTETGPAVGGVAPVKRYAYAQRYAWIKNAVGSYVQASLPVWVRTEERSCIATATVGNACAGGAADEVATTYDYGPNSGPNNLQIRGKVVTANGVSLRTCYGYDRFGNKISETSPRAGLTSCP